ncbi:ABC transporter ATP-binding protein [soil metagenome]
MTLDGHLIAGRGAFDLDCTLNAVPGSVVALLGPNGAGKTTVLRALAGLTPLSAGHLRLGERLLEDPRQQVRVTAQERRVGMVFQDRLLFPHLNVLDNVAFGPHHRGNSRRASRRTAREWLERTGLVEFASRRPHQLSGGQQQRVAITRALATAPDLLLLDEPLAAIDAAVVVELRRFLRQHISDFPGITVLVTHQSVDALVLADQVLVLDAGRTVQSGSPVEVARRPRTRHVAALMGLNLLRGQAEGGVIHLGEGHLAVGAGHAAGEVLVSFSPSAVTLHSHRPDSSARNTWPGRIDGIAPHGDAVRVHVSGPVPVLADVTPQALTALSLAEGDSVWVAVKAVEVCVYPA